MIHEFQIFLCSRRLMLKILFYRLSKLIDYLLNLNVILSIFQVVSSK